jgi:hypothetical protein
VNPWRQLAPATRSLGEGGSLVFQFAPIRSLPAVARDSRVRQILSSASVPSVVQKTVNRRQRRKRRLTHETHQKTRKFREDCFESASSAVKTSPASVPSVAWSSEDFEHSVAAKRAAAIRNSKLYLLFRVFSCLPRKHSGVFRGPKIFLWKFFEASPRIWKTQKNRQKKRKFS